MISESTLIQKDLHSWLQGLGYDLVAQENTGCIFLNSANDTCLILDTIICELPDYPYVSYTTRQNELMNNHDRVFRFLFS